MTSSYCISLELNIPSRSFVYVFLYTTGLNLIPLPKSLSKKLCFLFIFLEKLVELSSSHLILSHHQSDSRPFKKSPTSANSPSYPQFTWMLKTKTYFMQRCEYRQFKLRQFAFVHSCFPFVKQFGHHKELFEDFLLNWWDLRIYPCCNTIPKLFCILIISLHIQAGVRHYYIFFLSVVFKPRPQDSGVVLSLNPAYNIAIYQCNVLNRNHCMVMYIASTSPRQVHSPNFTVIKLMLQLKVTVTWLKLIKLKLKICRFIRQHKRHCIMSLNTSDATQQQPCCLVTSSIMFL